MSDKIPELDGVRAIFADELGGHVEALTAAAAQTAFSEKVRAGLENRFHVIRGGAGFLQLGEIKRIAEIGERDFRGASTAEAFGTALKRMRDELLPVLSTELEKLRS